MKKGSLSRKDTDLVRRMKHGDLKAMEEIVKRYSNKVYNLAYHLTHDTSAAEEIMQDVFLTVLSKIKTLENDSYFATWLYRVTTNAAYGFLRKERKYVDQMPVEDIDHDQAMAYDWSELPDDILLSDESKDIIRQAIESLPESMRTIVVMKDVEGLKNEEISEALSLSIPAVKSRLHRGRLMLRDTLSVYFSKYAPGWKP
jgi:RNA polymerase sigma-70 factor (ECF subfamily)